VDNIKMGFGKYDLGCGLDLSGSGHLAVSGFCEYRHEPLNSIKDRELLV
jgi:hypothetical protein